MHGTSPRTSNTDGGSVVFEIASRFLERYISCLKSSWAGKPAPHSPSRDHLSHNLEEIHSKERATLAERQQHLADSAKGWLFRTIAEAVESKTYGLKRLKNHKFNSVVLGNIIDRNPQDLMDKLLGAIEPPEVMIHGPTDSSLRSLRS